MPERVATAFNAHILSWAPAALVQFIFGSPARPDQFALLDAFVRRAAKPKRSQLSYMPVESFLTVHALLMARKTATKEPEGYWGLAFLRICEHKSCPFCLVD